MSRKRPEEKLDQILKVVMYSRIGYSVSPEADEARFVAQEDAMHKFCEQHKLEIKSKYREIAPGSLDHWSRPVYEKAVDDLKWSKKEKSVLLVSRVDRLAKNFGNIVRLMDDYNPKFLIASLGMRYEQFVVTIQAACAEDEFRFKYGKLYNTSPEGYQTFYNRHKFFTDLMLNNGCTEEYIAEYNDRMNVPLPWEINWDVQTIKNIMAFGEDK